MSVESGEHQLLFVYGTLKQGQVNYPYWMTNRTAANFEGAAETVERFPFVINTAELGSSPCVLDLPGDASGVHVKGELYRCTPDHVAHLDALEGVAIGVYKVGKVTVTVSSDSSAKPVEALIYFRVGRFPEGEAWRSACPGVPNGNFSAHWCLENLQDYTYIVPHLKPGSALRPPFATPSFVGLIIIDGVGDLSIPDLDGKTPLQAVAGSSEGEGLNILTKNGASGMMNAVTGGLACGSDTAHLAMFGNDPLKYYRGRGGFESLGAGMKMAEGDIGFKCNFATWDPESGVVTSRRADRNFTAEGPVLCGVLDGTTVEVEDDSYTVAVKYATEHRCGVVISGPRLTDAISGTDPLVDNRSLVDCEPKLTSDASEAERSDAVRTSKVVMAVSRALTAKLDAHAINAARIAEGKRPANVVLLRGASLATRVPSFLQRYGLHSFIIAPTAIIRGLGMTCGIEHLPVEGATGDYHSDYMAKARAFVETAKSGKYGFGVLHIKGVDDAGHDKNLDMKVGLLKRVSEAVQYVWDTVEPGTTLAMTADHSTALVVGDHSTEPVPFSVATKGDTDRFDEVEVFDEVAATSGCLGCFNGVDLVPTMLRWHWKHLAVAQPANGGN